MVNITLLNYIIMSLFIQDTSTLHSDLHQSYDNSMHSNNDHLFIDHIFLSRNYRFGLGFLGFLCVGISITISKYQFVFISEHVSS